MSLVSVVVTCYNENEFISDAIESVFDQSRDDLINDIIVVNDGSTDDSEETILDICKKDDRCHYILQPNQGLAVARNTGIEQSSGTYIAFLDGDDIWRHDKLERQYGEICQCPNAGLIYSDFYTMNPEVKRTAVRRYTCDEDDVLERLFIYDGPIVPSTVIVKRECFSRVGYFDPDLRKAQDTDMWYRIAKHYPIQHIAKPLVYRRLHGQSLGSGYASKFFYLWRVAEKAMQLFPELYELRRKKYSRLYSYYAAHLYRDGRRVKALWNVMKALYLCPSDSRGCILLGHILLPASYERITRWKSSSVYRVMKRSVKRMLRLG